MVVIPVGDCLILKNERICPFYFDKNVKVILTNGGIISGVLKKSEFCNRLWVGGCHIFIDEINEIYLA